MGRSGQWLEKHSSRSTYRAYILGSKATRRQEWPHNKDTDQHGLEYTDFRGPGYTDLRGKMQKYSVRCIFLLPYTFCRLPPAVSIELILFPCDSLEYGPSPHFRVGIHRTNLSRGKSRHRSDSPRGSLPTVQAGLPTVQAGVG